MEQRILAEAARPLGRRHKSRVFSRVGADLSTDWGDYGSGSAAANTPNAKAVREAVERLVKQILKKT